MLSVGLSASPYGQLVRNMTVPELKAEAVRVDIKHPGIGWSKCCPPTGSQNDIIAAVLGESPSTDGAQSRELHLVDFSSAHTLVGKLSHTPDVLGCHSAYVVYCVCVSALCSSALVAYI